MGFFSRLLLSTPTGTLPIPRETAGVPASTKSDTTATQTHGGSFEQNIVRVGSPQSALTISAVHRAIEVRAKTMGQLVMQYQRRNKAGGNFVPFMFGESRAINYLLQVAPNPMMTASAFFEQMEISKLTKGNAVVYIERDGTGLPTAFWMATQAGYDIASGTYNLVYLSERGYKTKFNVPKSDILHFPNTYKYPDSNWGIPTITFAVNTMSLIATENHQALDTAAKGGRVKLIIGEEARGSQGLLAGGLYDKPALKRYADELNNELYAKDVVAMRGLDKITNISMSAQDQQMIELLKISQDDIARFFGVPRPLLMIDGNSSYKTPEAATQEFLTRTIQPNIRGIEDEFNRKLLSAYDFGERRYHLCEQPLLRLDKKAQAEIDEMKLRTGVMNIDELRAQYDLPTVEGGDKFYISTNLAELGSEKLRGAAPQEGGES